MRSLSMLSRVPREPYRPLMMFHRVQTTPVFDDGCAMYGSLSNPDHRREQRFVISRCVLTWTPIRRSGWGKRRSDSMLSKRAFWSAKQSHHGRPPPVCC
jgi:hypothetical protein